MEVAASGPEAQTNATLSPDGRWLAFTSGESGSPQIYIVGFGPNQGKWQVSADGGNNARWSRDGRKLAYGDTSNTMLTIVPVQSTPAGVTLGKPKPLFQLAGNAAWDMAPDFSRVLVAEPPEGKQNSPFVILQNWQQLLK